MLVSATLAPTRISPAPGYRDAGNEGQLGEPVNIGHSGHSWSSTVSSTRGMHSNFSVTHLYPSYAHSRGYGFPLRCLSE